MPTVKLKVSVRSIATGDYISLHPSDSSSLFNGVPPVNGHFCQVLQSSTPGQYVGWAGHAASVKGAVEVSRPFASALGWTEGQSIELSPVSIESIPENTGPIVIQPCSSDDWEVVELQAEYLESALLSQIAVLFPGLKFPLWPEGGGKPIFMEAVWDEDEQAGGTPKVPFRLLSESDELAIEAKPRKLLLPDIRNEVKRMCRVVCSEEMFPTAIYDKYGVTCVLHSTAGVTTGIARLGDDIVVPSMVDNDLVDPGYVLLHPLVAAHHPEVIAEASAVSAQMLGDPKWWLDEVSEAFCGGERSSCRTVVVDNGIPEIQYCDEEGIPANPVARSTSEYIDVKVTFPEQSVSDVCLVLPQMLSKTAPIGLNGTSLRDGVHVGLSARVDGSIVKSPKPRSPLLSYIPLETAGIMRTYRYRQCFEEPPPSLRKLAAEVSSCIVAGLSGRMPASLPVPGVVVTGCSGSGKSTAARYAVGALCYTVVEVDCAQLASAERFKFAVVKKALLGAFKFACTYDPPSVLLLDDVDVLLGLRQDGKRQGGPSSICQGRSRVLASILWDVLNFHLRPTRSLIILGTAETVDGLEGLCSYIVALPSTLDVKDRLAILGNDRGEGYTLKEVSVLASSGVDLRDRRRAEDKGIGRASFHRLGYLGGASIKHATERLTDAIQLPLKYPALCGAVLIPKGAMLVGPPGCGKTALAMSVAEECGLPVVAVRGPELLSKYIGGSEARVRETFAKARARAPCVLFFDEVDALCPVRGADSTGVTDRVVNQMLTYLDGVEVSDSPVFVVAATSRPDMVDPALSRPGRLDISLLCDIPSGRDDLIDVLEHAVTAFEGLEEVIAKAPSDWAMRLIGLLSGEVGFTGADIRAALATAQLSIDEEDQDGWGALEDAFAKQSASAPHDVLRRYIDQFAAYRRDQSHEADPYHHRHLGPSFDDGLSNGMDRRPGSRVALA
ncbi:hypothetical protein Pmar_PMAR017656 [Perkinsus marinus ATCC 50983]|uniref:Peroxisomal ATPase PEX1 n=1 Tax=Perkinsus marinus (strain ATCC 50983 / TXsc) TaxID=423536 RepID=C5L3M4_PERM5|nr:hypothetical protein Pmar_PMAR017656 [Perkinsus marinus ATCC 50983]EER08603.1 hypothetical protein Pmar_PMAR017656 [Perkinsus marinus ATCC 50983]|eukprot:XP_002776787.1 hypothetical protein Pmar_PMAR017656 [Perkinsus marinus ATCC 50983]